MTMVLQLVQQVLSSRNYLRREWVSQDDDVSVNHQHAARHVQSMPRHVPFDPRKQKVGALSEVTLRYIGRIHAGTPQGADRVLAEAQEHHTRHETLQTTHGPELQIVQWPVVLLECRYEDCAFRNAVTRPQDCLVHGALHIGTDLAWKQRVRTRRHVCARHAARRRSGKFCVLSSAPIRSRRAPRWCAMVRAPPST